MDEVTDINRATKLKWNTIASLSMQIMTVLSGFILPRLILKTYGSDVNGLVNSVSQFLGVISLLDLGVGSVVQSALYKPLAEKNAASISAIYVSATRFFRRLAYILLGYIAVLMVVYPLLINSRFDAFYTVMLIAAIGVSYFAQYYFGIVDGLLVLADQKGYLQYTAQIVTVVVNTAACALLIYLGCSIQIVKLTTSLAFLIRPLFLSWYVRKNYPLDRHIVYQEEPIKQKWNGMAQHFAAFVLNGTDSIVLSLFSTLANVSIYSVYNTVIMGVKNALLSLTNGFQSLIGEMLAKQEREELYGFFSNLEWMLHTATVFVFGCTGVLLVSFVEIYTRGITDADYVQPLFAVLLTVANAGHCLRLPYNILIVAAGHYKQTQNNYIAAMIINIVVSVLTVKIWGLVGVAIGTVVAMVYQTLWMAWYDSRHILWWPFKNFVRQILVDLLTVCVASGLTFAIPRLGDSYLWWAVQAVAVALGWLAVIVVVNWIFYRDKLQKLLSRVVNALRPCRI